MNIRPIILFVVLTVGFAGVFVIPSNPDIQPAPVKMDLPVILNGWVGDQIDPSPEEIKILAEDTQFEKRNYPVPSFEGHPEAGDVLGVSIVLSGSDLNNSIHRPERCLVAQGFAGLEASSIRLETGRGTSSFPVRRIESYKTIAKADGSPLKIKFISYFWFVGDGAVTESHWVRTFVDMRDRLFKGRNQRWAFFSLSLPVTDSYLPEGGRGVAETDRILREFSVEAFKACVQKEP